MGNGKRNYGEWSKEELIREILALKKQKTYGLVWEREKTKEDFDLFINWEGEKTKEEFNPESKDKFPVLAEVKENEISSDKYKPVNLLIEGDNYHSLAVLNFTHKEMVDVIYIDPPYNTGNKDFKYNDRYVDKEDVYRHSKWLSFMSKRLALAKKLLKDSGVIFISIDDNEVAQLKILCDDIFREENFICSIIWQKVYSPKNQSRLISVDHEYILAYSKVNSFIDFSLLPRTESMDRRYKNPDNDPRGPWQSGDLIANEERKNGHYIITGPKGDNFNAPAGKHWAYTKENLLRFINDKRIWFGKEGRSFPRIKQFLSEVQQGRKASTFFFHTEVGHNDEAKKELKKFFEQSEDLFSTPKPTRLMKQLFRLCNNKDAVILDFFAGSGTTGDAVLSLNEEDKGKRKFILCTNNEDNNGTGLKICTDICYPRIQKVIKGYNTTDKQKIEGLGGNLKYYKTDFVEAEQTDKNKRKLVDNCTDMLCIKENTFEKVKDAKKFKIFKNEKNHLGIIFDDECIDEFVKEAEKISGKINVYVFSHDDSVPTNEFKTIKKRVSLKPIPEAILKVYRAVFKE
ncbi:site-specific DNA-methyltransferase [Candidatus Roizmanbacteria bacterium]|nr:site-specific DNA-methyltransferase [Candidatus Roizmanbacteria bacterium]